jgi:LysM repeat protein
VTGESAPPEGADNAADVAVAPGACPYLGMVGDRNSHHSFPSRLHLCHAGEPAHVGLGFQADYCLGGMYPSCARYQRAEEAAAAPPAAGTGLAEPAGAADVVPAVAAATVATATPSLGRVKGERRPRGTSPLVSLLLGVALIAIIVAFAAAAGLLHVPTTGSVTTPTPTGQPSASSAPTTPPASATPTPTSSPTPTPTPTPTPAPTASPTSGEILHTVQANETLTSIAAMYGVSVDAIVARNGITDPNLIEVGQVLIIPAPGESFTPPPTNPPTATPGPSGSPVATSFIYVVQPGDTLSAIAAKFNVTQQAILDANPSVTDPNKIYIGEELVIPAP